MMKTFIKSINRLQYYVLSIPKPNITPFDKLFLIYEKLKKKGVKYFGLSSSSIQSAGKFLNGVGKDLGEILGLKFKSIKKQLVCKQIAQQKTIRIKKSVFESTVEYLKTKRR